MKKTTITLAIVLASVAITACKNDDSQQNNDEQNTEITTEDSTNDAEDEFDLDTPEGRIANFKQQAEGLLKSYLDTQSIEDADAAQENFETVLPILAESLTEEDLAQLQPWTDAFKARADKAMKEHYDKLSKQ